jgi:hypothetical protein
VDEDEEVNIQFDDVRRLASFNIQKDSNGKG